MSETENKNSGKVITQFKTETDLKTVLATHYIKQINNYFGDEKKSLRFLSGVVSAVQRNPKLLACKPMSVINSFMIMAQLELMPSDVSGEAYVIPYKDEAQFQLGYQGLVTLFYRSGVKEIITEIVYEKDKFTYKNGVVRHTPDVFADDRGKAKGAYAIVKLSGGGVLSKVMSAKEILDIGKKFSKSFNSDYSPWDSKNDPQLHMWRKTVLKQIAKLVPKNEAIVKAIDTDNKDSIIADRLEAATEESESLTMGNLLKNGDKKEEDKADKNETASAKGAENDNESGRTI